MAKVQKRLQDDKIFKAKVDVAIAKQAAYQARTTAKQKSQVKKNKAGHITEENTPENAYAIQELSDDEEGSDNEEESEPEHVFTTTMVWSVSDEPQPRVLEIRDSTILDSGATIHVVNDRTRLTNFRPAKPRDILLAGTSSIQIEGFGDTEIWAPCPTKSKSVRRIRLGNCALVSRFHTNIVSLRRLNSGGVHWNTETLQLTRRIDGKLHLFCETPFKFNHWILEYKEVQHRTIENTALTTTKQKTQLPKKSYEAMMS